MAFTVENGLPPSVTQEDVDYAIRAVFSWQNVDLERLTCRFIASFVPERDSFTAEQWPKAIKCQLRHEKRMRPEYIGVARVKSMTPHPDDIFGCLHHFFAVYESQAERKDEGESTEG